MVTFGLSTGTVSSSGFSSSLEDLRRYALSGSVEHIASQFRGGSTLTFSSRVSDRLIP